jgi:hypothetical protein
MNAKSISKILTIRQSKAIWQCTVRRAPVWITPKNKPAYRPYILLVVDQDSEVVIKTEIETKRPNPQAVLGHLFDAMQGSILTLGSRIRPTRICVDDAELVLACSAQLAEVGVQVELRASLPQLNAALHEMEATLNQREPIPGLLSIPGASVPLVAELFAASAEYSRQAPWRYIENFDPIEVHYPADNPQARFALVLGSGGEFYGLSLYQSLADIRLILSRHPEQPTSQPVTWISLILEEVTAMSFEDLDAVERYGWEIASDKAYPLAMKITSGVDETELPNSSELAWLAAALRALPIFLRQQVHADRGRPQPAQASLSLTNVHANQQIALRYPVGASKTAGNSPTLMQDPELEAYIQDWHWDEKSHKFAVQMGQFMFEFFDELDDKGLSEQTVFKHERNCWAIGWLVSHYDRYDTFSPAIFQGGPAFTLEYEQKFSDSKNAINSYETTWRKLEKYASSLG